MFDRLLDSLAFNMAEYGSRKSPIRRWGLNRSIRRIDRDNLTSPNKALYNALSIAPLTEKGSKERDAIIEKILEIAQVVATKDKNAALTALKFIPFFPPKSCEMRTRIQETSERLEHPGRLRRPLYFKVKKKKMLSPLFS